MHALCLGMLIHWSELFAVDGSQPTTFFRTQEQIGSFANGDGAIFIADKKQILTMQRLQALIDNEDRLKGEYRAALESLDSITVDKIRADLGQFRLFEGDQTLADLVINYDRCVAVASKSISALETLTAVTRSISSKVTVLGSPSILKETVNIALARARQSLEGSGQLTTFSESSERIIRSLQQNAAKLGEVETAWHKLRPMTGPWRQRLLGIVTGSCLVVITAASLVMYAINPKDFPLGGADRFFAPIVEFGFISVGLTIFTPVGWIPFYLSYDRRKRNLGPALKVFVTALDGIVIVDLPGPPRL